MGSTDFVDALDILQWAQSALDTRRINAAGYGSPDVEQAVSTPVAKTRPSTGARADASGQWRNAMGYDRPLGNDWPPLVATPPTVLVAASWAELAPREGRSRHWRNRVWLGTPPPWPSDVPRGPLLFPSALVTDARDHRIGVLGKPETAPATPDGTHALVVAVSTATHVADALDVFANNVPIGQSRRYRAESAAYRAHAETSAAQLGRSLAWVPTFERELVPVPPFIPPVMPAVARGFVTAQPI